MICPKCGTTNVEGATSCSVCGNILSIETNNVISQEVQQPEPVVQTMQTMENPQVQPEPVAPVLEPSKKNGNSKIIIIVIAIAIILLGIGVGVLLTNNKKSSSESENTNTNTSTNTTTTDPDTKTKQKISDKCKVTGNHIHIADLTKKELKEFKIGPKDGEYFGGVPTVVELYRNSKVKSIIYNGKTYAYEDIVALTNDFNAAVDFIYANANTDSNHQPLTKELIKTELTKKNVGTEVKEIFHAGKEHEIKISYRYPSEALINGVFDESYYGKEKDTYNSIYFGTDYKASSDSDLSLSDNCSLVLSDGRQVHLLYYPLDYSDITDISFIELNFRNYED